MGFMHLKGVSVECYVLTDGHCMKIDRKHLTQNYFEFLSLQSFHTVWGY